MTQHAFAHGQHICAFYDSTDEQLAVAAAFIGDGLRKNERCLYVADSPVLLDLFRSQLSLDGIDVADAERSRRLLLLTKHEAHLVGGRFDSERMLRMLNDSVEESLNDGFAGLRTCGDMSWLLDDPPGSQNVVEYEAVLNEFFRNVRGLGMCQYDRTRLPVGLLDHAGVSAHSSVVIDGRHKRNPFFDPARSAGPRPYAASLEAKLADLRRA